MNEFTAIRPVADVSSFMNVQLDYRITQSLGDEEYSHLHGKLTFTIGDRIVPYMSYFGDEDVCYNEWLRELATVLIMAEEGEKAYLYDEGEQGQPAYLFEFDGETAFLSIVDSPISEQEGDPDWQKVPFAIASLKAAYQALRSVYLREIKTRESDAHTYWAELMALPGD
ncbi:hypothetical protein GCM10028805_32200 [Spirosoma harenae]